MIKPVYIISLILLLFAFARESFSQDQTPPQRRTRQRTSEAAADKSPVLTERAKIKNEEASKGPSHIVWLREIYRNIDLQKESNSPLYFPTQPIGERVNLFTLIFKLAADGKIKTYNYLAGREIFTEKELKNFKEVLESSGILYTVQGSGDNVKYLIEDSEIPSEDASLYMIKEGWYFDEATGTFKSQIIAICPMLVRMDYDTGEVSRTALFWIPYEEIRPYLSRELIMTSNYNNALTYTMDDFFSKRMYDGEIIKTTNMMNQSLLQQVGDNPEALKHAQDSIENQLKAFDKNLWVYNDTIPLVAEEDKKAVKKATSKEKTSGRGAKKESAAKTEKPKASKAEKSSSSSSSSPARSVRRK